MDGDPVSRFLAGDSEVVEEIRSTIAAVVRRFRLFASGSEDELKREALGRVFLSLAAGRFRGEASLETFAGNVAKYTCLEHLRRRRADAASHSGQLPTTSPAPTPEEILLRDEKYRAGLRAVSSLPADCVQLIHFVFVLGLPFREVAERLGVSEGTLRVRLHRCRARLAEENERASAHEPRRRGPSARREGTIHGPHE